MVYTYIYIYEPVFRFFKVINATNGVNGKSIFHWGVGGWDLWLQRKGLQGEGKTGFVCSQGGSHKKLTLFISKSNKQSYQSVYINSDYLYVLENYVFQANMIFSLNPFLLSTLF